MSKPSGFVPINFHKAGQLLLIIGTIGLSLYGISTFTGWLALPSTGLIFSLVSIAVSLYLIFIVSGEKYEDT